MRKLLLALGLLLGSVIAAQAQVPCVGVGTVVNVPQTGLDCPQEPMVNTFAASSVGIVPASSATDLVCIAGKAGTVLRLQKVVVSGSAGTAIGLPISITKNAVADTAGTQATAPALPVTYSFDPLIAATVSIATWQANTANPTINDTGPGIIATQQLNLPTTAAGSGSAPVIFNWESQRYAQAPILRAVAQQLCLNLNSTSVSSGKINSQWWWTESSQ